MPIYLRPYMLFSTQVPNASQTRAVEVGRERDLELIFVGELRVALRVVLGDAEDPGAGLLETRRRAR